MNIKAIIFDLDGIITDTEPVHMDAWLGVLESLGIAFDEEEYKRNYVGLNDRDFLNEVGRIHKHHFSDADKANLIEDKIAACVRMLEYDIPLLPGIAEFIRKESEGRLLAICSGANRGEIEFILRKLRWENLFNPVIASDSVGKGKPDPEGYIRAMEGLIDRATDIILPENFLAVEDSPKGIEAAKAAGIKCLAVTNSYPEKELSKADHIVKSLADLDLEVL